MVSDCVRYHTPSVIEPWFGPTVPYQPILYDQKDLAWTFWLAHATGAPFVFLFAAEDAKNEFEAKIEGKYSQIADRYQSKVRFSQQAAKQAGHPYQDKIDELTLESKRWKEEYEKLKSLTEFEKRAVSDPASGVTEHQDPKEFSIPTCYKTPKERGAESGNRKIEAGSGTLDSLSH